VVFYADTTIMIGLRSMVKKHCDNMLSRFHLIPERDGQTDGQTDRRTECYISVARQCADDKNERNVSSSGKSARTSCLI